MTTNPAPAISTRVSTGFQTADNSTHDYGRMKSKVAEELKQHFRPEFLNRVDDTIVFPPLTAREIARIVDLMTLSRAKRMEYSDTRLQLTDEARVSCSRTWGFDPVLGARPLCVVRSSGERMRCLSAPVRRTATGQVVTAGVTEVSDLASSPSPEIYCQLSSTDKPAFERYPSHSMATLVVK